MEIYEKRGRWVVDSEDTRRKFNTKAEAEAYAAGLGSPVEEPTNGDEKKETYTEEFNFSQEEGTGEEKDSSPFIGISEEDSESKSEEE
jgi:hypothetical protein